MQPHPQGPGELRACHSDLGTSKVHGKDLLLCQLDLLSGRGKGCQCVDPDFSEAFDMFSHSILLQKLATYGLDWCTISWVKTWLDGQAQRVVGKGFTGICNSGLSQVCSTGLSVGDTPAYNHY